MELLLELLLTMVLSVLIAFLLGKIVSVGAPDGDDPDAGGAEEGAAVLSGPGPQPSDVSARVVSSGEVIGEGETIGEIRVKSHAEGREMASGSGDDCVEVVVDRRMEEIVHRDEVEVEGEVVGSEEPRAKELGPEDADGGEKIPGPIVEETEENLGNETTEEVGRVARGLPMEEKLPLAKDAGQVVGVAPSLDEEREEANELDTGEVGTESVKDGERPATVETDDAKVVPCGMAMGVGLESGDGGPETSEGNEKMGSLFNEDDDWEGIEKSDLEKLFAAATAFLGSNEGSEALAKLSSDLQMQLYGLHKVATEGPCYESQPMSLKVSARAKWHAWQRLGSMSPEIAMEQYVALVSDNIPGWRPQKNRANDTAIEGEGNSPNKGLSGSGVAFSSSTPEEQFFQKYERNLESHSYIVESDVSVISKETEQGDHVAGVSVV